MTKLAKLQLAGPVALAIAIVFAESSAQLLAAYPTSTFAWYLNLEVFGIFQRSHYVLSDAIDIPFFQLLFVAIPLMALAGLAIWTRQSILIAATSHFGLIYAGFVGYTWHLVTTPSLRAASLTASQTLSVWSFSAADLSLKPQTLLLLSLLAVSLLSFAGSQYHYLRAVRQR